MAGVEENYVDVSEVSPYPSSLDGSDSVPITYFQRVYGLSDEFHSAVLDVLNESYGFGDHGDSGIDLLEFQRRVDDGVIEASRGPEIEIGEYMKALRDIDNRTWHDRVVDALLQTNLPDFLSGDVNALLCECNYNNTAYNSTAESVNGSLSSDIDFAKANFSEDSIGITVWEAKAREKDLQQSSQLEDHKRHIDCFADRSDIDVFYLGLVEDDSQVHAREVNNLMESTNDSYTVPRGYYTSTEFVGDGFMLVRPEVKDMTSFERFLQDFVSLDNFQRENEPNIIVENELTEVEQSHWLD